MLPPSLLHLPLSWTQLLPRPANAARSQRKAGTWRALVTGSPTSRLSMPLPAFGRYEPSGAALLHGVPAHKIMAGHYTARLGAVIGGRNVNKQDRAAGSAATAPMTSPFKATVTARPQH